MSERTGLFDAFVTVCKRFQILPSGRDFIGKNHMKPLAEGTTGIAEISNKNKKSQSTQPKKYLQKKSAMSFMLCPADLAIVEL